jgi:hypothetical protein
VIILSMTESMIDNIQSTNSYGTSFDAPGVHFDKFCLCCCDPQAKTFEIQNIAETVFLEPKKVV